MKVPRLIWKTKESQGTTERKGNRNKEKKFQEARGGKNLQGTGNHRLLLMKSSHLLTHPAANPLAKSHRSKLVKLSARLHLAIIILTKEEVWVCQRSKKAKSKKVQTHLSDNRPKITKLTSTWMKSIQTHQLRLCHTAVLPKLLLDKDRVLGELGFLLFVPLWCRVHHMSLLTTRKRQITIWKTC